MVMQSQWTVYKEFRFEAAHILPKHEGKCRRLHGHSWVGKVYIQGNQLQSSGSQEGMLLDFSLIESYIEPIRLKYLDHFYLNESTQLENPTSEELARWIYEKLELAGLPGLDAVEIHETCTSGCIYKILK